MEVEAFRSIINPDDAAFANPPSMVEAIQTYCRETGQAVPETPAEICRCIFDSLALRYRQVFGWIKELVSTAKPSSAREGGNGGEPSSAREGGNGGEPSSAREGGSGGETAGAINVLHIIGGGSLNKYLNQFTADALGVEVLAGPQECTAIGNIMLQAKASGDVSDIWEMRRIIAASVDMVAYHPTGDTAAWDRAYARYLEIISK
jgi:rhamnulokinase